MWPENVGIVKAFMAVASQWRVVSLATGRFYWQGLRYADVRAGLAQADIALTPSQWADLQVMENAAASALNGYRG